MLLPSPPHWDRQAGRQVFPHHCCWGSPRELITCHVMSPWSRLILIVSLGTRIRHFRCRGPGNREGLFSPESYLLLCPSHLKEYSHMPGRDAVSLESAATAVH